MKRLRVTAKLGGAGPNKAFPFLEVPEAVSAFGHRGRIPVVVRIGKAVLRMSLAPMGGVHLLGFSAANAKAASVAVGDRVTLTLEVDEGSRAVSPPPALEKALRKNAEAKQAWAALAPSHQREHAEAILQAKKPETVARRVEKTIEMLTTTGRPMKPAPSTKPLATRLGFKPGLQVSVIDAPKGFSLGVPTVKNGRDGALVFVMNRKALERVLPKVERLAPSALWFAYPKTTSGLTTDLTRDEGWMAVDARGLRPVTQVSVDEVWSALRFRKAAQR